MDSCVAAWADPEWPPMRLRTSGSLKNLSTLRIRCKYLSVYLSSFRATGRPSCPGKRSLPEVEWLIGRPVLMRIEFTYLILCTKFHNNCFPPFLCWTVDHLRERKKKDKKNKKKNFKGNFFPLQKQSWVFWFNRELRSKHASFISMQKTFFTSNGN